MNSEELISLTNPVTLETYVPNSLPPENRLPSIHEIKLACRPCRCLIG